MGGALAGGGCAGIDLGDRCQGDSVPRRQQHAATVAGPGVDTPRHDQVAAAGGKGHLPGLECFTGSKDQIARQGLKATTAIKPTAVQTLIEVGEVGQRAGHQAKAATALRYRTCSHDSAGQRGRAATQDLQSAGARRPAARRDIHAGPA